MSKAISITVHVGPRWWFKPALQLLLVVTRVTKRAPNQRTIHLLAKHGMRCSVRP